MLDKIKKEKYFVPFLHRYKNNIYHRRYTIKGSIEEHLEDLKNRINLNKEEIKKHSSLLKKDGFVAGMDYWEKSGELAGKKISLNTEEQVLNPYANR